MKAFGPPSNLRRLTRVLGSAIVFFGLILIAIIGYAGWSGNDAAIERDKRLVQNALDQSVARILNEQKSVAWWDLAVTNISSAYNADWTAENVGVFLSETYGQDEIYIFDKADALIYSLKNNEAVGGALLQDRLRRLQPVVSETRSGKPDGLAARADAFGPSQEHYQVLSGVLQCGRWAGHILTIDGRPAVVAGITVCPTVDFDLLKVAPAVLVSVVFIDAAFVGDMGSSLLLPDLALASAAIQRPGVASEPFVTDEGARAGVLSWTPRQPGRVLVAVVLPLVALGVVAAGLLASAMLRRLRDASNELAEREALASYQARHDALSGLPNRHRFAECLQTAMGDLQAAPGRRLTVAFIDVDRFKDTNDTLGHQAGDELIKAVAKRLRERLDGGDLLARFGGDEFAVLRTPGQHGEEADWVASLMATFAEPFHLLGQSLRVTASIGLASAPDHGRTPEELMRTADIALYAAKERGRDQAVFFSSEMADEVQRRRTVEVHLRDAIGSDQLVLHYQPVISCQSNEIVGVEALLRWLHPVEGVISPGVFIPIAEEAGLMPALGSWVLDRAFADAARWPELEVAVNLSPAQFHHLDLEPLLAVLTARHKVDPGRIVLEITEGLLLESSVRVKATLESIRRKRFKVALDDFGTGYSSLNYLNAFRFDKLKIDRSFVRSMSTAANAQTIVHTVISLGRNLGMEVIAEGVETEADAAMMRLFGCSSMQGFLFSKAVPPEELERLYPAVRGAVAVPAAVYKEAKTA